MSIHWNPKRILVTVLTAAVLSTSACMSGTDQPTDTNTPQVIVVQTVEPTEEAPAALLTYQGPAEMGSPDGSQCATFQLDQSTEARLGGCDGTVSTMPIGARTAGEWQAIRERFAPFVYESPTEKIDFAGMGAESGAQWQRALLAWARARRVELATGGTSATISTAMSWHLGQDYSQKNVCMHLTVLEYGYAYAEEILCEGLDLVNTSGDWLSSDELTALDTWLYQRAPLYVDKNYIDGKGTEAMSEAETAAVPEWAMAVWSRLRGTSPVTAPTSDANSCPEAQADLAMVRAYGRGFCLLVPGDYTVFDNNPDDALPSEMVIAKESLLNVTDPRLHINVRAAEGRSVEAFADELVASMTGSTIKRSATVIAGQQAVVLDDVPGQDINRRVLIVANDRLYDLTFTPMSSADLEVFYATIIAHFTLVAPES